MGLDNIEFRGIETKTFYKKTNINLLENQTAKKLLGRKRDAGRGVGGAFIH